MRRIRNIETPRWRRRGLPDWGIPNQSPALCRSDFSWSGRISSLR